MAQIPRSSLDGLTERLNALSEEGKRLVRNALRNAEWDDVAELREILVEAMEAVCATVSDHSAALTAEFYDGLRERSVGEPLGAVPASGRDPKATEGAVRAFMQSVVETGATDALEKRLMERVGYEVRAASGRCMMELGELDPLKPKYARVPAGPETCLFCRMLASRGFAYNSAESAGELNHYHDGCDCRIVCSWDDDPAVEGYTPEEYDEKAYWENRDAYKDWASRDHSAHEAKQREKRRNRYEDGRLKAGYSGERIDRQADYTEADRRRVAAQAAAQRGDTQRGKKKRQQQGALNDSNDPYMERRDAHAARYYEAVRKRDRRREIDAISRHSGIAAADVEKAYEHLFISEYDLASGRSRFDPSYDIAESWRRLREGRDIKPQDVILLQHEAYEYDLMKAGLSYGEAHKKAEAVYNYAKAVKDSLNEGGV